MANHVGNQRRTTVPIRDVVPPKTLARFLRKLVRRGKCLVYIGHRTPQGYGMVHYMKDGVRYPILAHRLAWVLEHGTEIPAGLIICHRCHNKACCEPAHLHAGTAQDNANDTKAYIEYLKRRAGIKA